MICLACIVALSAAGAPATPAAPEALVRGVVRRADSGEPLAGASVELGAAKARTDSEGAFELRVPPAQKAALHVSGAGFLPREQPLPGPLSGQLSVQLALTSVNAPGRVVGTARTSSGGRQVPVAGARVETSSGQSATTDAAGQFVLEGVGPGPVPFVVQAKGFTPAEEAVSVPPGGEAAIDVTLQSTVAPALVAIRGKVRAADGKPVAAVLRVVEKDLEMRSDAAGKFAFQLPAGQYTLHIEAPKFIPQSKAFTVEPGDQVLLYVDLSPKER